MNIYGVIALTLVLFIFAVSFGLEPAIQKIFFGLADVFTFKEKGSKPHLFDLAVFLALAIVVVSLAKVIFSRRDSDDR